MGSEVQLLAYGENRSINVDFNLYKKLLVKKLIISVDKKKTTLTVRLVDDVEHMHTKTIYF